MILLCLHLGYVFVHRTVLTANTITIVDVHPAHL